MAEPKNRAAGPAAEGISELVMVALAQEERSGLSEMLRVIAQSVDATACILWQETPGGLQLFTLADWVPGEAHSSIHNLSLLQSATGEAIRDQVAVRVEDVATDPRVDRRDPFLKSANICCFCSIPLTFLAGKRGALNAYRTTPSPFTQPEIYRLEQFVYLLPSLYETILDKVSYKLLRKVSQILDATNEGTDQTTKAATFRTAARDLCRSIAEAFSVLEVSLFLENPLERQGEFRLVATTWPDRRRFAKPAYIASKEEGLTGWVLEHQQPVIIFDLAHFERDRIRLRSFYPGITWKDSLHIETSVRKFLNIAPDRNLQPLSFMAVPILAAGKLLGVLRCCTAIKSPYHFGEREKDLLELVAAQIGQAWINWLHRSEIEEEIYTWERLADSMKDLNQFVEQQVAAGNSSEKQVFDKALEAINSVIPGAKISDVRLLDKERQYLYFASMIGKAWQEGSSSEVATRRDRRFYLDKDPPSGGSYVVKTGEIYSILDTDDTRYYYSETFPDARSMIISPISVAGKVFGVLDIRSTSKRNFPPYALRIAEIIGQQLGLYRYLLETFTNLQHMQSSQAQTFEDFTHQLKSPIHQVHARIQIAVRLAGQVNCSCETLSTHLLAIRGLAAKAEQVGQTVGIFAELALGKSLRLETSRILADPLVKILIEAAIDQESILDPERRLQLHVHRDEFKVLEWYQVILDINLLLQAIYNLLDNATKYSYSGTTITIHGGITNTGRFHISVLNQGIPITTQEIRLSKLRGWRSLRASQVTGEGSGIGLWIVDNIMQAHKGELLIIPTTPEGWTEVKLLFPATPLG